MLTDFWILKIYSPKYLNADFCCNYETRVIAEKNRTIIEGGGGRALSIKSLNKLRKEQILMVMKGGKK